MICLSERPCQRTSSTGQVDRLEPDRPVVVELVADAHVPLVVFLDVVRVAVGSRSGSPAIRYSSRQFQARRADQPYFSYMNMTLAVSLRPSSANWSTLDHRVVEADVAVDDRVVGEDAEAGLAEEVLATQFPAVQVGLVLVDRAG